MLNRHDLIAEFSRYVSLSEVEAEGFLTRLEPIPFSKRQVLVEQGKNAEHFLWIRNGCTMAYHTDDEGHEQVMQFAVRYWWTTDLRSFMHKEPATLSIQALSDGDALALHRDQYNELLDDQPVFERYFRKIFTNALIVHQRRIMRTIGADAEAHYRAYLNDYPGIEQWVPQKYIASYLGITPEFLSKLRRRMVKR